MNARLTEASLKVHPSVLFKLGEDLISDGFQALAELVKNAYDADSDYAVIRIITTSGTDDAPDELGYLEVLDGGCGMTIEDIQRGWLTVSDSRKSIMKRKGETTAAGRTPLGDKGLGRLGAQRLGDRITIETSPKGEDVTHRLSFSWQEFHQLEHLSDADLRIESVSPRTRKQGTTIRVSKLRELEIMANTKLVEQSLTAVISPYKGVVAFQLEASVNGEDLDLRGLEANLLSAATVHYSLEYTADDELQINGRIRLSHLRPNSKKERPEFETLCEIDNGEALLRFIAETPLGRDLKFRRSKRKDWWAEFQTVVRLSELSPSRIPSSTGVDQSETIQSVGHDIASPGPFHAEVDGFNLGAGAAERIGGFDSIRILRDQVNRLAGIRVYRNGFTIRMPEDWLRLGQAWTSGGSWYGLRPGTTIGYVALTASDNAHLIETTDREGFSRTPHFDNFTTIMQQFVAATKQAHQLIGRSWVEFRRIRGFSESPLDLNAQDALTDRLNKTLAAADTHRDVLVNVREGLVADAESAAGIVDRLVASGTTLDDDAQELAASLNALGRHAAAAATAMEELEQYIDEIINQKQIGQRLQAELDSLEDQLTLTYETVGLGLTAEALSHEIANIADRLARRTSQISSHLRKIEIQDGKLLGFIEHVRGSISGLRRQIAHLAPSLRYVRERREPVSISRIAQDTVEYFDSRWSGQRLGIDLSVEEDATVLMNPGKLLQVFDNLLLNAEYWLRQELESDNLAHGMVTIQISGTCIEVWDNGKGVDPEIETSLFEPFTTRKPTGEGRGLGLFISTQLLESDACSIRLLPDRNSLGHRYKFLIDLGGAAANG